MFDWSSFSDYRLQPNPWPTRVHRSSDWPDEETTGRWSWRVHGESCAPHSCPFLMRYDWFSPQKAMFDWSSDSDYWLQPNPWTARVQRSPDWPNKGTSGSWYWRVHGGSCAGHSFPYLMRYDYGFLLKRQCLIKALIQTTVSNRIHGQQGTREALTGQMWGLQAGGVEELMEEVQTFISISNEVWLRFSP